MAKSKTATKPASVDAYLQELPAERRAMLSAVRDVVLKNLPEGYVETYAWGISYVIPLETFPKTYNGHPLAIAALHAQKNYCTIHLMAAYGSTKIQAFLAAEFKKRGKKLDMGKACVRFKSLDDLPLDVIGEVIARVPPAAFIERYEASRRK